MPIAEAIFGAVGNSHGVIAASPEAQRYTQLIVGRTDLPSSSAGVDWKPFESGFVESDRFFLSRTFADPTAPRGGMVFTHTLIAPWTEIDTADGLSRLIGMLTDARDRSYVPADRPLGAAPPSSPTPHLNHLLDLVLNGSSPVVWLGELGLADALGALWKYLPTKIRQLIAFRLSFGPHEVTSLPRFVSTPRSLATKWTGKSVIDPNTTPPSPSAVSTAFLTDGSAQQIQDYAAAFGISPNDLDQWSLVQQAWSLSSTEGDALASLLTQTRYLISLSPDGETGTVAKRQLMQRLATALNAAGADVMPRLRNLDISAWPDANQVWSALRARSANQAQANADADDASLWRLTLAQDGVRPEWREAMLGGFDDAVKTAQAAFWEQWWTRWSNNEALIALIARLPKRKKFETAILRGAPANLAEPFASAVLVQARSQTWLSLHGLIAARTRSASDAFALQLEHEADTSDGLAVLSAEVGPAATLDAALAHRDPRLVGLAVGALNATPALFSAFDVGDEGWRMIATPLLANAGVRAAIPDPAALRLQIADLLRGESAIDEAFLVSFSSTEFADLSAVDHRESIWRNLQNQDVRQNFLNRTARGWLRLFASGAGPANELDPVLRATIVDNALASDFLVSDGRATAVAMRFFEHFPELSETAVLARLDAIKSDGARIAAMEAEALGKLLAARRWTRAASKLANMMHSGRNAPLAAAAAWIEPMLQAIELQQMWLAGWLQPSDEQVWTMFRDLATKLYQGGPMDRALWSRADGDDADVPFAPTPRAQWHAVISGLRNGQFDIRAKDLLRAMQGDYPNNGEIKFLRGHKAFR